MKAPAFDRRGFLALNAGLLVTLALPAAGQSHDAAPGAVEDVPAQRLDSWLAIDPQGRVLASVGKIDAGLGIPTAFAQIVADELDVPLDRVQIRMGDTATTVDQRGTGSSNGINDGGGALRAAAAQARTFLVARAAERFGLPVAGLEVRDGVVVVSTDPSRAVSYGELLKDARFELAFDPKAKLATKDPATYRHVGKPVPRVDIPLKVKAEFSYLVDLKVKGMVHARLLRPPTAGAQLLAVEALPTVPGFIRLVRKGNFVAVVCEREEQALRAARETRLRWSAPTIEFAPDYDSLYDALRRAPAKGAKVDRSNGNVDDAWQAAQRRIESTYEYPFQSQSRAWGRPVPWRKSSPTASRSGWVGRSPIRCARR